MFRSLALILGLCLLGFGAQAAEWMLKATPGVSAPQLRAQLQTSGQSVLSLEDLRFGGWFLVRTATDGVSQAEANQLGGSAHALWVEPNRRLRALNMPRRGPSLARNYFAAAAPNPVYRRSPPLAAGPDPLLPQQWALQHTGLLKVRQYFGNPQLVVAVIDSGVDYNHPELNSAIWLNPGEAGAKSNNGIDDDGNGYIDDFMGWNFADNNNQPFDKLGGPGGNEGHGTHCAGSIAAAANNSFGIQGIAPGVRIMPLKFLKETGDGADADAFKAMKYAIDMGAAIISNSWGGADENTDDSRSLREIFAEASARGRLVVVAAGNEGLDVDSNPGKTTPASYNTPLQINVAALDSQDRLANFSNTGLRMVHLGAPGVGILSTVPGGKFMSMDGTSMAGPIVAGAAALFWSQRPDLSALAVKSAILSSLTPTPSLMGKTLTGGRLNIETLMGKVGHPPLRY